MQQVKKGNTIKVHYTGTLREDGSQFDSSIGSEPLEFTVGEGLVIFGFDNGVINMHVGDKRTIEIPALEAYGPLNEHMIFEFDKKDFPADLGEPEIGIQLHMSDNEGNELPVVVAGIKEETIVLDANHPLAGKDLIFEVEVVEIVA